jgi:hypothetical protein
MGFCCGEDHLAAPIVAKWVAPAEQCHCHCQAAGRSGALRQSCTRQKEAAAGGEARGRLSSVSCGSNGGLLSLFLLTFVLSWYSLASADTHTFP